MFDAIAKMEELGIEFEKNNWFDSDTNTVQSFTFTSAFAVPNQIITILKNEPMLDLLDVAGDKSVDKQIVKYKKIVFHPQGKLQWALPDVSGAGDFVAICAKELVLNGPGVIGDMPLLNLLGSYSGPPNNGQAPTGPTPPEGPAGSESGDNNGHDGGTGGDGYIGGPGLTWNYPTVYIFFNKITINLANPAITSALKLNGNGVRGGTGGEGGRGGRGGNGATGSSGNSDFFGCTGGNGGGGTGGVSGRGGKGGKAGKGGNGATLSFVGPDTYQPQLSHVELYNVGGPAGTPGQPGQAGSPGNAGGAGSQPTVCGPGRGNGNAGTLPDPRNLGPGDNNMDGFDGAVFTNDRDNSDIFV